MDIKAKIEEIVKKITSDKTLLEKFKKDPTAAVKEVAGVDIPADQIKPVVDAVKTKITADGVGNVLGGILGKKKD